MDKTFRADHFSYFHNAEIPWLQSFLASIWLEMLDYIARMWCWTNA